MLTTRITGVGSNIIPLPQGGSAGTTIGKAPTESESAAPSVPPFFPFVEGFLGAGVGVGFGGAGRSSTV